MTDQIDQIKSAATKAEVCLASLHWNLSMAARWGDQEFLDRASKSLHAALRAVDGALLDDVMADDAQTEGVPV